MPLEPCPGGQAALNKTKEDDVRSEQDDTGNQEGEILAEMPTRRTRELCELCHRRLHSRPSEFPQINVREHLQENGGELTPDACFECHDPHSPI